MNWKRAPAQMRVAECIMTLMQFHSPTVTMCRCVVERRTGEKGIANPRLQLYDGRGCATYSKLVVPGRLSFAVSYGSVVAHKWVAMLF